MKYYQIISVLLFVSSNVFASDMSSSFNEARELGKANNNNAQSIIKNFNPHQEFKNFNANPRESSHYTGITGNDPNLNILGMQELNSSEVGKSITTSTTNNPKAKISIDSDFLQGSKKIQENAAAISGLDGKQQCVNKILTKTIFNNHFCEKDQVVNAVCKIKDTVEWTGSRQTVNKELIIKQSDIKLNFIQSWVEYSIFKYFKYNIIVDLSELPKNSIITGYELDFKYNVGGIRPSLVSSTFFNDITSHTTYKREDRINVNFLSIPYTEGEKVISIVTSSKGRRGFFRRFLSWGNHSKYAEHTIKILYKYEEDTLKPELKKISDCNINTENNIELSSQCTQKGGVRNFFKDGKNFELSSDCWEETIHYLVGEASDNECRKYESNPNCNVSERECLAKNGEHCIRFREKYQCSRTLKTDGKVCGDKFFCSDGSCSDLEQSVNTDFGHAVSQLASLAKAGEDISLDQTNMRAFSGKAMFCRKSGFGFSNCCKDSGWGHKLGLAHCNSEETALGRAKERNLAIYVGDYCDKRIFRKCVRRKNAYCVFDNKLARIVQLQGRSGQLGLGFGGARNPNCRGLNVEELQNIKFDVMDYSDFYSELDENKNIPNKEDLIKYMNKSITEQMQ